MVPTTPSHGFTAFFLLALIGPYASGRPPEDASPSPPPGNVTIEGEEVVARLHDSLPAGAVSWRVLDETRREVARGELLAGSDAARSIVRAGALEVGWYRIEALERDGACVAWTTAAVLARLRAPPPEDSPVAVDAATAWFARDDPPRQAELSRLAALAGVRWVRDRLRWSELQPAPRGLTGARTTYDTAADLEREAGLDVLQVFHDTPAWAADPGLDGGRAPGRFARDLRHVYGLAREAARRFRGRVRAWEPWNEANIQDFGGHSVDEMCAWQKVAWLGFKAGDPQLIVGWNAYAGVPSRLHTEGVLENEAWPYFDTYNIHSYDWPESYVELWAPAREAASGRPIWVTEADRGIRYTGEKPWCELSAKDELRKARHLAHEYCYSLFAGAAMHFHFILGHYTEDSNGVQFGLLRLDRTPRPAYVALAALGRLLAGARCLGRWTQADHPGAAVFAFRARPDGVERDVLVAWCDRAGEWDAKDDCETAWSLPAALRPEAAFDGLGRPLALPLAERLGPGAIFVVLPAGGAAALALEPPPPLSPRRDGTASPVVLQLQLPSSGQRKIEGQEWTHGYDHTLEAGQPATLPIFAYDFSDRPAKGTIRVEKLPPGATIEPSSWDVSIGSMERVEIRATYRPPEGGSGAPGDSWIRLRGDFGDLGRPVIAFRLVPR